MNELTTTSPADQFRAKASALFIEASNMTLHQLVDEFQRLTTVMDENMTTDGAEGYPEFNLNEAGQLAARERKVIEASSKARFGIGFDAYDRPSCHHSAW